jgi:cytochrome c oxidase cbb3-type subunit III
VMRPVWLFAIGCITAIFVCAGCNGGEGMAAMKVPVRPQDVVDFWALYNQNCSACHGENGQGGPALDLANPVYQAIVDNASLKKWITNGMTGTEMPAFGESAGGFLSEKQVDALVAGMRANWAKASASGPTPPPYLSNLRGDEKRGEQVYREACVSCHEKSGERISDASYLALVSDQGLRTIIIAGRPDLGQPNWEQDRAGGPLTDEDATNVVAYLASLRSATPGQPYPNAAK